MPCPEHLAPAPGILWVFGSEMDVIALSVSCKPFYNWVLRHVPPALRFQILSQLPKHGDSGWSEVDQ